MNVQSDESQTKPIRRVLIVDDSAKIREDLKTAISTLPHLQVIGEASDGIEALSAVNGLQPDLVTLDIRMPKLNGFEVLRGARLKHCEVVVLSGLTNDFYRKRCHELGVEHFFDKITEFDQFLDLLKTM